jgi:hypothetical protein
MTRRGEEKSLGRDDKRKKNRLVEMTRREEEKNAWLCQEL